MKVVTAVLIVSLSIIASNLPAQGNGIVNKLGQEQVLKIVSKLRNGMPAAETTSYLSECGLRSCMAQNYYGTLLWWYSFTNAGTHTVRWISRGGETNSADLPNERTLVLQFGPKNGGTNQEWRSQALTNCILQAANIRSYGTSIFNIKLREAP